MFANRLAKRLRQLRKWAAKAEIDAFRLYERDIPEYPAVVDWYGGEVVAWLHPRTKDETEAQQDIHEAHCIEEICSALEIPREKLFVKERRRQKNRREGAEEGQGQYQKVAAQSALRVMREQGLRFEVNLSDYLDTGLFLDHRTTRDMVRQRSKGLRVLNLFAYTGSFTCYAIDGGAVATTTVDMSATYQAWALRNLRLNGWDAGTTHRLVEADCLAWLDKGPKSGECYDLIVCDPPTFSNSKKMEASSFSIDRDWPGLLGSLPAWLSESGTIWFSSNSRKIELEPGRLPAGFAARDLSKRSHAFEFREGCGHRLWMIARQATFDSWQAKRGK
ncbi:MAG: class I SAM-dependent methyltransferase [Planctomycetes bacterium]|nr:class I SAM-dependent methyltransferase [Planctomycetota bacterium]